MKKLLILFLLSASFCFSQNGKKNISGLINDGKLPISNVSISVEKEAKTVFSNESGKYIIQASIGDVLKYSYQGMKTVRIKVEDVTRILNVTMVPDIEELEEVIVVGSNRKSQNELALEYSQNPNLIKTAYGILNADTAPGNIRFMHEDEINQVSLCILDLLRNQFSGVRVQGSCLGAFGPGAGNQTQVTNIAGGSSNTVGVVGLSSSNAGTGVNSSLNQGKVFIRGGNSISNPRSAIFDVDGQIFNDPPIWIDVKNIRRLAILNNFATTTQYGSAGAGGVVVINTITASPKSNKIYDQARLRNNFVSSAVYTKSELKSNWPTYLKEINESTSFDEAKTVYESYAQQYSGSPYFALDMQTYFQNKWNNTDLAESIIDSKSYIFDNNPVLLKSLAYQLESQGEYDKANEIYKKVLKLRPNYAQSYIDIANSYRDLRNSKQAAAIYTRYNYLLEEGLLTSDSITLEPLLNREYNNFLLLEKANLIKMGNSSELYVAEEDFKGTRIVFDWNDSEAEFELQFVNPSKQYTMFKHSQADNSELIDREKDFGFSTAEFFLDDSLPGTWSMNINYLGNKSLTPTYLKATVYYNYGSYSQRKEVKVFKLSLKNINQSLFNISVGSKLVAR